MRVTSSCPDYSNQLTTPTIPLVGPLFRQLVVGILSKGKSLRFCALGCSMHPTIRNGDTVTLIPITLRRPHWGDVVAIVCDPVTERVVVHRIIRMDEVTVETRGDALPCSDGIFPHTALLGVVTKIERDGQAVGTLCALWPYIPLPVLRIGRYLWRKIPGIQRFLAWFCRKVSLHR